MAARSAPVRTGRRHERGEHGRGRGVVGCAAEVARGVAEVARGVAEVARGVVGAKRTASSLRLVYSAAATASLKQIASAAAAKTRPAAGEVHGTCSHGTRSMAGSSPAKG